jgi:hypothetical protein
MIWLNGSFFPDIAAEAIEISRNKQMDQNDTVLGKDLYCTKQSTDSNHLRFSKTIKVFRNEKLFRNKLVASEHVGSQNVSDS